MKRVLVAVALLALFACGSDKANDLSPVTTTTPAAVTPTGGAGKTTTTDLPFVGSAAPVITADTAPATLTAVDIGLHDGFERVVFRFSDHVPGMRLQPSPGPFAADGSGEEVHVDGSGFLALRMTANGHDANGHTSVPMRTKGPKRHSITEVVRVGDFEGVLSFVIGLDAPQTFRVLQTSSPPRIVIDIASN